MKSKSIILLIIAICFLSCSVKKENYKLINDFLNDPKAINLFQMGSPNSNKLDSIYISKNLIKNSGITKYSLDWEKINLQNPFYMGVKVKWNDEKDKISLTQTEMSYFRNQIILNEDFVWDQKKFNSNKIILVNTDEIYKENNKYYYNGSNQLISIHYFTRPVYNKQKNIALIGYFSGTNSRYYSGSKFCMLIMKKENKKWFFIGYETDVGVHD
jgi:hypothetical protein